MAKDVYMLHNLQCISGSCTTEGLWIYSEITDKSKRKWEQEVVQPFMAIDMSIILRFGRARRITSYASPSST